MDKKDWLIILSKTHQAKFEPAIPQGSATPYKNCQQKRDIGDHDCYRMDRHLHYFLLIIVNRWWAHVQVQLLSIQSCKLGRVIFELRPAAAGRLIDNGCRPIPKCHYRSAIVPHCKRIFYYSASAYYLQPVYMFTQFMAQSVGGECGSSTFLWLRK